MSDELSMAEDPLFAAVRKEIAASKALRHYSSAYFPGGGAYARVSLRKESGSWSPISSSSSGLNSSGTGGVCRSQQLIDDVLSQSSFTVKCSQPKSSSEPEVAPQACLSDGDLVVAALEQQVQLHRQRAKALEAQLAEEQKKNAQLAEQLEWDARQLQQSHARADDLATHTVRFQELLAARDQEAGALRLQVRELTAELTAAASTLKSLNSEIAALRDASRKQESQQVLDLQEALTRQSMDHLQQITKLQEALKSQELQHLHEVTDLKHLVLGASKERAALVADLEAAKVTLQHLLVSASSGSSLPRCASEDGSPMSGSLESVDQAADAPPADSPSAPSDPHAAGATHSSGVDLGSGQLSASLVDAISAATASASTPPVKKRSGPSTRVVQRILVKLIDGLLESVNGTAGHAYPAHEKAMKVLRNFSSAATIIPKEPSNGSEDVSSGEIR
jgi:hypothetical protein